jgi:sugar-specific transcriptional regulator TrmB
MLENQLKKLGFSKNLSTVYLALFKLGKVRAGEIIKNTKMHRSIVYEALEELVERELVTKTELRGVFMFQANDPGNLVEELERKKNYAEAVANKIRDFQEEAPREITVFEGLEGIKEMRSRSLNLSKDETVCILGGSKITVIPEWESFWRSYHKKRLQRNINLKILFDHSTDQKILDFRNKLDRTEARYLPPGIDAPVWFGLWGDTVEIGIPGKDPIGFNIKSKDVVEGFKKYFDFMWEIEGK